MPVFSEDVKAVAGNPSDRSLWNPRVMLGACQVRSHRGGDCNMLVLFFVGRADPATQATAVQARVTVLFEHRSRFEHARLKHIPDASTKASQALTMQAMQHARGFELSWV